MTATMTRPRRAEPTAEAERDLPEMGEDGFPVRYWEVEGKLVAFSLRPYAEDERPLYWNPVYPGCDMLWRAQDPNAYGFTPAIQRETWIDGKFSPRNAWEEHMTREWMLRSLPGCNNPDKWRGVNHPDGEDAEWRCQCTWHCGNWRAFEDHRRYLRHPQAMDD